MKIGIDKIDFYIPSYYLDMTTLGEARNVDPNKYIIGLGQEKTAIVEPTLDCISMAANAADKVLTDCDKNDIELILFATESSIDESKAGALFLHDLLELNPKARTVELKQACCSAAVGMQLAKDFILAHPGKKVLLLASDIAKYGLKVPGEPTQGAGAIAMVIAENPRILELEDGGTYASENVTDFFRPTNHKYPVVDGKLSLDIYIRFFQTVYNDYLAKKDFTVADFAAICCHMPFPKLGQKALKTVTEAEHIFTRFETSKYYNKQVGNIYTGSLFLSFMSLIEQDKTLEAGERIGFFAYGSGATAEFFSGKLVTGYEKELFVNEHADLLANRSTLTIDEYETLYGAEQPIAKPHKAHKYTFATVIDEHRTYQRNDI